MSTSRKQSLRGPHFFSLFCVGRARCAFAREYIKMAVSVAQKAANFDLCQSLAAGTGEWKTRKINLFQVLKGFVSQLKLGQDLTKVSLPAEYVFLFLR
jgi:hypothetical protein